MFGWLWKSKPSTLRRVAMVLDILATVVVVSYVLVAHENLVKEHEVKDGDTQHVELITDDPLIHRIILGVTLIVYCVAFALMYVADVVSEERTEAQLRALESSHPQIKNLHAGGVCA